MKRKFAAHIFLVIFALVATGAATAMGELSSPGRVDLAGLDSGSVRELKGQWAFWWRQFIDPAAATDQAARPDAFVVFPGEWKDYPVTRGDTVGFATLRLEVSGLDPSQEWAIKLSSVQSAARLYINGVLASDIGTPGVREAAETPRWDSRVIRFTPKPDGTAVFVLHISNFHDRSGGLKTPLLIGGYRAILAAQTRPRLAELFLLGAIMVMGLYYLFLFAFRPSDRSALYFGLLCLTLGLRTVCYDEFLILEVVPELSWEWLFRLGYLMFSIPVFLFSAFVRSLFPKLFPKAVFVIVGATCGAYTALFAAAPTLVMARSLISLQACTLGIGLFIVYVLIRAAVNHEKGSLLLAVGFLLFFAAAIHDILDAIGIIRGEFLVQSGLLVFLFSMSLVITRKFAASFARAESLSEELSRTNRALKRFVPEEFLSRLGKSSIDQVSLGDHSAQEMTVMFADIRQFSYISEQLTPEENFRFINQYLARMGPAIRNNGGFVDKYLGDGVMALFPGSPENAVRCAIEMHRRLEDYNSIRFSSGQTPIKIGIGIHTGRLMLGTIGENERMDGTVISDVVNIASRIEGITKDFSIGLAVSERILLGLADVDAYLFRFLGKIGVRGKREPVSVFELFDGDPDQLRLKKSAIKGRFERGLTAFYSQDYPQALGLFKEVLADLPEDDASAHYMRIIRKLNMA